MPKAQWNGVVVAESDDTVVVEGNHYFPRNSLEEQYAVPSDTTTECGWKGIANYLTLDVNGTKNPDAIWYYENPKPEAESIRGRIAFWKGVEVVE